MFALTLKSLWAHKLRFALTGLAVVLGVAFMSGTMVLTDTMGRTFDDVFETANEGVDVVVYGGEAVEDQMTEVRERVSADVVGSVRGVDGVAAAEGSIRGFAQITALDGTARVSHGLDTTIGSNWIEDGRLNPLDIAEGRAPKGPKEVVVDKASADDNGWAVGDHVTVLAKAAPRDMVLVGVATYGSVDGLPGTTLVATDTPTAQELFAEPGAFDSIVVAAVPGTSTETLARDVADALRSTAAANGTSQAYDVVTGQADTADKQADMKQDLGFFNKFLMAFAYIALFVGMFIIYNTFSIVVAQRTRDMAMLRAIGASRRQVLLSVLLEALAVGLVAAAAGLGLGIALSYGLRALLGAVGLAIPSGSIVVTAGTIVVAAVVGVLITVVSALAPARRASAVRPIEALRSSAIDTSGASASRTAGGLVMTAAGVALFAAGTAAEGSAAMPLLGLGALLTIVGVFVLGPTIVRPILRTLGVPAVRLSGQAGLLARENARRNPRRTAATAAALMIGVALVGFITILASSTKSSVSATVDRSLRADYVVDSGSWGQGGFSPVLADEIRALPDVTAVSPLRTSTVEVDGSTTQIAAVDTATIDGLYDLDVAEGSIAAVEGSFVAVDAQHAADAGLAIGDVVTMRFPRTGDVELEIAATFDEPMLAAGDSWLIDLDTFTANVSDQYDRQIYVATDGIDAATSSAAIERVLADWPNAELQDQAGFKESMTDEIDQILNLIYGLLALAIVIALIGVANTLALSVHERTREIGLLRAVGMTRSQIRASVRWESIMIALFGTLLGGVLAVLGAWGVVQALGSEGVTTYTVPVVQLAVIATIALGAGVLAASGPARRAARLDVLRAIEAG